MNKNFQELALQAWALTRYEVANLSRVDNRSVGQDEITDIFESKFAELIYNDIITIVAAQALLNESALDVYTNLKIIYGGGQE